MFLYLPAFVDRTPIALIGLGLYLGAGALCAHQLRRQHHPWSTALSAVIAWPALWTALHSPAPTNPPLARGPAASRIDAALAALREGLAAPLSVDRAVTDALTPGLAQDLDALAHVLRAADARLALTAPLLAESPPDDAAPAMRAAHHALATAHAAALADLDDVVGQALQLRLQLGLHLLQGDQSAVREQLRALSSRAATLREL